MLRLIAFGGTILVIGWLLIFLVMLGLLPDSFLLGFGAYAMTLIGFVTGLIGVIQYVRGMD